MFKLYFLIYIVCLNLVDSFKNKSSSELFKNRHVTKVGKFSSAEAVLSNLHHRIGYGYDIHRVVGPKIGGKILKLGGLSFPEESVQVVSHSDGDVVLHSISDAILGALGKGDIGDYFPDTDPKYEDYDSSLILREVMEMASSSSYQLVNVDVCIILEYPKLGSAKSAIRDNLIYLLGYDTSVNVKAKTNEKLDSIGSGSAVACHSVALLKFV